MQEQTVIMHAAERSRTFSEIVEKAQAVLFEGSPFVLGLGIAYLAVCYGIPMPTQEKLEENNP